MTKWRRQVALVSQEPVLFKASVLENLRYGNRSATREEAMAAYEAYVEAQLAKEDS